MTFNEYFEKIQRQISRASSLEALLVWRKRINIVIAGLPYKANKGCLVAHCYTSNKKYLRGTINMTILITRGEVIQCVKQEPECLGLIVVHYGKFINKALRMKASYLLAREQLL